MQYESYRQLLKDFYFEKKRKNRHYTYRHFSKKAEIKSPNYLKLVMDGDRKLTHPNIVKFIKGLDLVGKEGHYFENLVLHNQSADEFEKAFFQRNMEMLRVHDDRGVLTRDQFEVLSNWYPLAIKELMLLPDFQANPRWISSKLNCKISPTQASDAIEHMIRLHLLVKTGDGSLIVANQHMQTPNLAQCEAVKTFHHQVLDLAKDSIRKQESEHRCLSALTFAIRKEDLAEAFRRIHEFRNELDSYFSKGGKPDAVYQFNMQLFRLDTDV